MEHILILIGLLIPIIAAIDFLYYAFLVPRSLTIGMDGPKRTHKRVGEIAYIIACALSVLRLPLGLIPYLAKLLFFFALRKNFRRFWHSDTFHAFRLVGDLVNLGLVIALARIVSDYSASKIVAFMIYIPVCAEFIRLILEKEQTAFSGIWQLLPHRRIASAWNAKKLTHYCHYYSLSDNDRMEHIICALKSQASADKDLSQKLEYIQSFRIVPRSSRLRTGLVRDVARGEVFIHRKWTNDPWLLIGQAIRRSPWIFDPRYLRRPFYYRSEANPILTVFVIQHAIYSPPFALYQLGHAIKNARYGLFFIVCHWLGINIESKVRADGTAEFEQFIQWLERRLGFDDFEPIQRALWTENDVAVDVAKRLNNGEVISAMDIAAQYTYPLKYIEEVLLPQIVNSVLASPIAHAQIC